MLVKISSSNIFLPDSTKPLLNQCWLIINEIHCHLAEGNFTETVLHITPYKVLENYIYGNTSTSLRGKQVKVLRISKVWISGIILGMGSTNDRWCYNVMSSLIGLAYTQNDTCIWGLSEDMSAFWSVKLLHKVIMAQFSFEYMHHQANKTLNHIVKFVSYLLYHIIAINWKYMKFSFSYDNGDFVTYCCYTVNCFK